MSEEGDDLGYLGESAEGQDSALSVVGRMSRRLEGAQGGVGDFEDGGGKGRGEQSRVHLGGAWTYEYASGLSARMGYLVCEHVRCRVWLTRGPTLEARRGEFLERCDGHCRTVIFVWCVPDLLYAQ